MSFGGSSSGSGSIDGAADVAIDSLLDAQVLTYNQSTAKWVNAGPPQVDITSYGAKGDGVTDDTAALKAAVAAISAAGGGTVHLRPGKTYLIATGYAELQSNTTIAGHGAVLFKPATYTGGYAFFAALSHGAHGYGSSAINLRFESVTFRGDVSNGGGACAFAGHHAANVVFEQCRFEACILNGHAADLSGCSGVHFNNCVFAGARYHTSNDPAEAIQVDTSYKGGLSITDNGTNPYDGLATRDVWVRDCQFIPLNIGGTVYPAPTAIGSHAIWEDSPYQDIHFIGNKVEGAVAHGDATYCRGNVHFVNVQGLWIENNTFVGDPAQVNRQIGLYGRTIGFPSSADPNNPGSQQTIPLSRPTDIHITNNTYRNCATAGTEAVVYADNCDRLTMAGETYDGCGVTGSPLIYLEDAEITVRDVAGKASAGQSPIFINVDGSNSSGSVKNIRATGMTYPLVSKTGTAVVDTARYEYGKVSIDPVANTPTAAPITFAERFGAAPILQVSAQSTVPGTAVMGVGWSEATTTGAKVWVTRTNTTTSVVSWMASGDA
jgi:hypothetical protein